MLWFYIFSSNEALDPTVVNRIAAGEVIIAPANALKELLENSVDAGSTNIEIVVKDGGLKLLQIKDNGCGIDKQDLGILCLRFTTSKLSSFEDLSSIATYGFRGEALASISHIAHLTVTTKTKDSACAWKAAYHDGYITPKDAEPQPTAGNVGTQIVVEDLFFNIPSRLRAFKSGSEEFSRILDVVGRYGIHCKGIAFSCKKHGDAHTSVMIQQTASIRDRIRTVYGSSVADELVDLNLEALPRYGLLSGKGLVTNANYSVKRSIAPVLFINNRLVSCDPLRRAMNQVYSAYLPRGAHFFIYLSLEISPANVDVNVHPTKREVRFLYQEEIVESVSDALKAVLTSIDSSRTFQTQTILPGVKRLGDESSSSLTISTDQQNKKRVYEYNMIRTDAKQPKITSLYSQNKAVGSEPSSDSIHDGTMEDSAAVTNLTNDNGAYEIITTHRERVNLQLTSINELRTEIENSAHGKLTTILSNHTFVGIVDFSRRLAAIQHNVQLFLVDYAAVCQELFYQVALSDFGNFGTISLNVDGEEGFSVTQLLEKADQDPDLRPQGSSNFSGSSKHLNAIQQLSSMSDMLEEYFSITLMEISKDQNDPDLYLVALPMLLVGYVPPISKLHSFLNGLVNNVDWTDEKKCFQGIMIELASFYVPESLDDIEENQLRIEEIRSVMETQLFPSISRRIIAPKALVKDVVEIASLPGLYKVFERC